MAYLFTTLLKSLDNKGYNLDSELFGSP